MGAAHVLFWLYVVALMSGSASIAIVMFVHAQHAASDQPRPVVVRFALFLGSLLLIVASMALQQYKSFDAESEFAVSVVALCAMVVGAGGYMFAAPFFYHSLVGSTIRPWLRALYLMLASVFLVLAGAIFAWPASRPVLITLNVLLFGMVAYGIVFIALRYRCIGDRKLRRAVRVFIVVSAIFFPLMYLDSILAYLPRVPIVGMLDGTALPLFYLLLNCLSIAFAATYLNEPPYVSNGRISPWFKSSFGISDREGEIIGMLLEGNTSREVAERLFISSKTVENHVYNIYQKTRVRNRVELVNLMLEHRGR